MVLSSKQAAERIGRFVRPGYRVERLPSADTGETFYLWSHKGRIVGAINWSPEIIGGTNITEAVDPWEAQSWHESDSAGVC